MRVGIDITSLLVSSGGVGRYLRSAITGLLRHEAEAHYHFFPVDFDRLRDREHGVLEQRNGRRLPGLVSALGIWSTAAWSLIGHPSLDRFIGKLDVFHGSDLIPLPQRSGRNVATIYDMAPEILPENHNPRLNYLHRLRNRDIRRNADMVIAISENTKADVVRLMHIDPERVAVVHGGVSASFHPRPEREVEEVRVRYGLNRPYLIFVGTLEPRKNLPRLVRAFARVRKQLDEDTMLAIVGRKGWQWEPVAEAVAKAGLEDHVRFVGYVPEHELPAMLTGAKALVYPSLYEGFGFPPLEAMACGTPVVASNVSCIPEVVNGAGILVDPLDELQIADGIGRAITDVAERERLIRVGSARAAEFPWDRTGESLLGVYRSLAERS